MTFEAVCLQSEMNNNVLDYFKLLSSILPL